MSAHVTIGFDGSEPARDALALGRMLADALGAPIRVVTVYPVVAVEGRVGGSPYESLTRYQAAEHLREAQALLGEGARADFALVPAPSAARALAGPAEEDGGIIVVGSNHRGRVGQILLGGTGTAVLRRATAPVAIAPRGFASREPRHALIGLALSADEDAGTGLDAATGLAERLGSRLRILHVLALEDQIGRSPAWVTLAPDQLVELRERATTRLDTALSAASPRVPAEGRILEGAPGPALRDAAADLDLLVLGPRASWLRHLLGGSVTHRLAQAPPCPLVVLPRDGHPGGLLAAAADQPVEA